jgi:hypothetical protein
LDGGSEEAIAVTKVLKGLSSSEITGSLFVHITVIEGIG